jgi:hypothetical protein
MSTTLARQTGTREFWAGALFTVLGLAFLVYSGQYRLGTPERMGPAFVPGALAGLLVLLGVALAARGWGPKATPLDLGPLRPLAVIVLAVVLFATLLLPLGLVLATTVLVLVSTQAGESFRWRGALLLAAGLSALAAGVFVWGLGVPAPLWPALFDSLLASTSTFSSTVP